MAFRVIWERSSDPSSGPAGQSPSATVRNSLPTRTPALCINDDRIRSYEWILALSAGMCQAQTYHMIAVVEYILRGFFSGTWRRCNVFVLVHQERRGLMMKGRRLRLPCTWGRSEDVPPFPTLSLVPFSRAIRRSGPMLQAHTSSNCGSVFLGATHPAFSGT